jgi:hypothetical protein
VISIGILQQGIEDETINSSTTTRTRCAGSLRRRNSLSLGRGASETEEVQHILWHCRIQVQIALYQPRPLLLLQPSLFLFALLVILAVVLVVVLVVLLVLLVLRLLLLKTILRLPM